MLIAIKILGFTKNSVEDAYVGSWISSSRSNYHNERRYYATLIHFIGIVLIGIDKQDQIQGVFTPCILNLIIVESRYCE